MCVGCPEAPDHQRPEPAHASSGCFSPASRPLLLQLIKARTFASDIRKRNRFQRPEMWSLRPGNHPTLGIFHPGEFATSPPGVKGRLPEINRVRLRIWLALLACAFYRCIQANILPHKSHNGRCSSTFRAAIIIILSRDRRKMSQQTPDYDLLSLRL